MVNVVVIPMIVFAHVGEDEILKIKSHSLIVKILTQPGSKSSAQIPIEQIERLKILFAQSDYPVQFEHGVFSMSDNVIVSRGKLMGLKGEIVGVANDCSIVRISVDFLGGAILEIKSADIEKITK